MKFQIGLRFIHIIITYQWRIKGDPYLDLRERGWGVGEGRFYFACPAGVLPFVISVFLF